MRRLNLDTSRSEKHMNDPNDYLPLNPRDFLVLMSLTVGDKHGYRIVREVEEQSGGVVKMDPSNLYRSIKRLMNKGLVKETEAKRSMRDKEQRRYYAITPLGRKVVKAEATRLDKLTAVAHPRRLIAAKQT